MYEFLDRRVTSLDLGGRFLVWAMRSWVAAASASTCPARAIAPAFGKYGMLPALHPFLHMMAVFNRFALETFSFGKPDCKRVLEHEAIILAAVACQGSPAARSVPGTLALLLDEEQITGALEALARLGHALDAAELALQLKGGDDRRAANP